MSVALMSAAAEIVAPLRIAVLVSGRGSNLRALAEAQLSGELPIRIVGVFSDKPDCAAMALARQYGIPIDALRPKDFASREAFDEELFNRIAAVQPDLIVCAGYMRIISDAAVRRFQGRMINIHPSLLPKYPGLNTHARALAAGDTEHGASVHLVIPALDAGPVLAQARIAVQADDTPETLARRVLAREHALLVQSVGWLAERRGPLHGTEFRDGGQFLPTPLLLNDDDHLEEIH
jgi:phosphoribosylglycinamide formyltransferase-1